jgi:DNA polymerase III delta prime subunit
MPLQFVQAKRAQSHARIALVGPPGSGKTYSALRIAAGLGCQRIGLIDSERGKSKKQSGKGIEFGVLVLPNHSPRTYCEALEVAAKAGLDGLIVDSLSHEWTGTQGALEMVASVARGSESGNEFAAWKTVSPEHSRLFDMLLGYPGHVIGTMRSRKAYEMVEETNRAGRPVMKPREVGLVPVQREGYEYEFDVVGFLEAEHRMTITKTCCEAYPRGAVVQKPGEEFGQRLAAWLRGGGGGGGESRAAEPNARAHDNAYSVAAAAVGVD